MPLSVSRLKAKGVSSGDWKPIFTTPEADRPTRIKKLVRLLADRTRDGRQMNLSEWRAYAAIDLAFDAPFNQTTPTIIGNILSKNLNAEQTLEQLSSWGLSEKTLFREVTLPNGQRGKVVDPKIFAEILIPVTKAYTTSRTAKLYGDRNTSPLLPYRPIHQTGIDRVRCEILTDMISKQSANYGYPSVLRQSILQQNKYGISLTFPREEWHCLEHEDDDGVTHTVKEGLRYIHPHPTRMFYDLKYPLTSLNSDTGCEWVGHWHVTSYGEIFDNRMYWNRDAIFCGTNWFLADGAQRYFSEIFPCAMDFPSTSYKASREDKATWYSSGDRDKSVFLTEIFVKLIPKNWGLGDYKYPIWCRFTLAGDDTVIFAEPCAYCPSWFMGYDYDDQSDETSSMALECIPWQDAIGNILSQMWLTAKQNLKNLVFYDQNQVTPATVEKMENAGESLYQKTLFVPYDSMNSRVAMHDKREAFQPMNVPKASIQELAQMIPLMLSIMERMLQVSAQEAGGVAAHYQSKYEVQQVGGAVDSRLRYTGSFTDDGIDAWKRQLYHAARSYKDTKITAEISATLPEVDKHLLELGFKVVSRNRDRIVVTGSKRSVMELEDFAASNQGPDVGRDKEVGQVLMQTIQVLVSQPELVQAIGVPTVLKWIEQATILIGGPEDMKLEAAPGGAGQMNPATEQAMQQLQQTIMQTVDQKVAQPAAQAVAQVQQEIQQMTIKVEQLNKIFEVAKRQADAGQIKAVETQQEMQIDQAKFQAEERRRDEEAAARIKRDDAVAASKVQRDTAASVAKAHSDAYVASLEARMSAVPEQRAVQQRMIESINYRDAGPTIRAQMEAQAGFTPAPLDEPTPAEKVAKIKADAKPKAPAK